MAATVLIIDDDPAAQRLATFALRQDGHVVNAVSLATAAASEYDPTGQDLVVLDTTGDESGAHALLARIRKADVDGQHLPVILLTAQGSVDGRIRALRAGADDTVEKPYHPADLVAHARGVLVRHRPAALRVSSLAIGKVAAFYGVKGGVGTTTLAVNTAVALQKQVHRQVALVDGSLQYGDIRVFLDMGVDQKTIVDLATAPAIDGDLVRSALVHDDSGVDVLLAPLSPETAELITEHHLPEILRALRPLYQYVVIDVGHRLDDISLHAMDFADVIFVVMTADLPSLKNARSFLETIANIGFGADKTRLILNRSTALTGIRPSSIEAALERRIDYQIVNEYARAMAALNSGTPIMVNRADSKLGKSILEFARAVDAAAASYALPSPVLPAKPVAAPPAKEPTVRRPKVAKRGT